MTKQERMKSYLRLCDEATSNLDALMSGEVLTPLCCSCCHTDMKYGTSDSPVCDIYDKEPLYLDCKHFDCPDYKQISDISDSYLPKHMRKNKQCPSINHFSI